nr:hypothetical protein [Tanacetum cinerariifolium]
MGKRAPEKSRCLTINLHHDGVFTVSPFEYSLGDEKQITDIHFEGTSLKLGIKIIKTDSDVDEFVIFGYRNKWQVNLYVEHSDEPVFANDETVEEDSENIDPKFNVKSGVTYIRHDPNQNWKKWNPNDWRKLLVYYGRDVEAGRCAGYDSIKKKKKTELGEDESLNVMKKKKKTELGKNESLNVNKVTTRSRSKIDEGTCKSPKTPVKAITSGEGCFESPSLANNNKKDDRKKPNCSKNYNLGSLVTYRWIAHHYAKQLIADPFIPTLKMKTDIREKFLINVSLGQCKRAKQRALFDYEGGLKEQYGRLWVYRQAILNSNLGSTCRLDDEETESGHYYFRRIYVCFKGVKEGWLAGCRKMIGLDGCFLKYACSRELLVAMGRDANNQMYRIAWAVVKVENNDYWCWFISLMQEDLHLETGEGLTIISDSHKGSRGGRGDFRGRGKGSENIGESSTTEMSQRGRGRGQKGRGSGERGRGKGERGRGRSHKSREMTRDEIRKNLEHDYMEELLLQEEQKLQNYETEQDKFDQEALRLTLEEEAMYKRMDEDRLKEKMAEEEWDRKMDYYHPSN